MVYIGKDEHLSEKDIQVYSRQIHDSPQIAFDFFWFFFFTIIKTIKKGDIIW